MNKILPCCYFPTLTVCIDDSFQFLESLKVILSNEQGVYKFFDKPFKALDFLNEEDRGQPCVQRIVRYPEDDELYEQKVLNVNLNELYKEIYNQERFMAVSAMVVDFAMPGVNGVDLCRQIEDPNIYKILLTGEADEHLAIKAFNDGVINKYIRKQDPNLSDLIAEAIEEGREEYFRRISSVVYSAIHKNTLESAVSDPIFEQYFRKVIKDRRIIEFYMIESLGSYLCLDKDGSISGLFVKDEDQMEAQFFEAKDEEELPESVKKELEEYKKVLCCYVGEEGTLPMPSDWEECLKRAELVHGRKNYYCGYKKKIEKIDCKNILSFNDFRKNFYSRQF